MTVEYESKSRTRMSLSLSVSFLINREESFGCPLQQLFPRLLCKWNNRVHFVCLLLFFLNHLRTCLLILERGGGREKERETSMWESNIGNTDPLPLLCTLTGNWTLDLGMCPDCESNCWSFGYGTTLQPAGPHQPGLEQQLCLND